MNTVATIHPTYLEQTRPERVEALMWVAQHAGILADGYIVSASSTFDERPGSGYSNTGVVRVQGESGSLASLVALFAAVRQPERPNAYVEWVTYDEGVRVEFVEEPAR